MSIERFITTLAASVAAAVAGALACLGSFAAAGLTGIPTPLFLIAGPAALLLHGEPTRRVVIAFLCCGGIVYGLYAFLVLRYRRRGLVWSIAVHGLGAALAALTVGP